MSHAASRPTAIDLFSGAGGVTTGLKQAGFRVVAAVESDEAAMTTYKKNHRTVKTYNQDIRELTANQLLTDLAIQPGELCLLAGCPPCQGFSKLRTRNGNALISDVRNGLIGEFARFVEELRPKAIMMENVPGLANSQEFYEFLERLRKLDYPVDDAHKVLDIADFGVAQRRRRLIFLSIRSDSSLAWPSRLTRRTVRDEIGGLPEPGSTSDTLHRDYKNYSAKVMDIIASVPTDGGSRAQLPKELQLACHQRVNGFSDVYGRMSWDTVSPTITSGCNNPSKGRFIHPQSNRVITLREAALLQGFPKSYRFCLKRGVERVALQIGNALPPPFIKHHAKAILKALQYNVWPITSFRAKRPSLEVQSF